MTTEQYKLFKYCINPLHWPMILLMLSVLLFIQLPRLLYTPFLGVFIFIVKHTFSSRIKIVNQNLSLCFPDYPEEKRKEIEYWQNFGQ